MSAARATRSTDLPPAIATAQKLRGTLTGEPAFLPTMSEEQKRIELLSHGAELGLWRYRTMTSDRNFLVQINGRDRLLAPGEVYGWVLGVLDTANLEVSEFAFRAGLE